MIAGFETDGTEPSGRAPSMNSELVTRRGSRLMLAGEVFRFNGANAYWLGLDENVGGVAYPTRFRIKNALDTAAAMGLTVIRSHMMTSTSRDGANPLALMPALGQFNEAAFDTIDYAVAYAGTVGIRLILPLTDEWSYYHGGHRDFTEPWGLPGSDFYHHERAIEAFEGYVDTVVRRTNALTGIAYANDPTVLAWELGNELEGMTAMWIDRIAGFIKTRAPHQLIAAGRRFGVDDEALAAEKVDIVDAHYYPPTAEALIADAVRVTDAGKVYVVGEYGSDAASSELLRPLVDRTEISGLIVWSLFPHADDEGYVEHDDGFTLHFPGETPRERQRSAAIVEFSRSIGSAQTPGPLDPPVITAVVGDSEHRVSFRGSAGAVDYLVEHSADAVTWAGIGRIGAHESPVIVHPFEPTTYYRVSARRESGESAVSEVVAVPAGGAH